MIIMDNVHWWLSNQSYNLSSSFGVPFLVPLVLRRVVSHVIATTWPSLLLHTSTSNSSSEQQQQKKANTTTRKTGSHWLDLFAHGPLGYGASKLVMAVVGISIYQLVRRKESISLQVTSSLLHYCQVGTLWPGHAPWLPLLVGGVAVAVNAVLWVWSTLQQTRGNHSGVENMVADSTNRTLSRTEHMRYLTWAAINATCEEVVYRGLVRSEFHALWTMLPKTGRNDENNIWINLAQATTFGIAHYYGIPSGLTGVGLTLIYGGLMGVLADVGQGLFWPIITHTIADYYIFVTIARRKLD
jgi:membrane protease YdiL (CAAX protease family)